MDPKIQPLPRIVLKVDLSLIVSAPILIPTSRTAFRLKRPWHIAKISLLHLSVNIAQLSLMQCSLLEASLCLRNLSPVDIQLARL